jgi:hypothetical protein
VAGAPAGQVQHLPGEVPAEQDEDQRAQRDHGDGAAGQRGLGGEREQRHAGHDHHGRADDALELLAAQAQVAPVVAAVAPEDGQPGERQADVRGGPEDLDPVAEAGVGLLQQGDGQPAGQHGGEKIKDDQDRGVRPVPA